MKKTILILTIFFVLTSLLTSCENEPLPEKEKEISVVTIIAKTASLSSMMNYVGVVRSNQLKNYSFKTGGYIENIFVDISQKIVTGDPIASLDTKDLIFQMEAAGNNMDSVYSQYQKALNGAAQEDINNANLNVDKAKSVYEFNKNNYNDMTKLFEKNVISLSSLEQAKLNMEISEKEYLQAVELLNKTLEGSGDEDIQSSYSIYLAAKNTYEGYKSLVEDSTLYCDYDGTVLSVFNEEGDAVTSGYPIVVTSSTELVTEVGVSIKDIYKLDKDIQSIVTINKITFNGSIESISEIPDPNSLTYLTTIKLDSPTNDILIGSTAQIKFILGETEGIWLDISTVLNDGEDYVYLVEDGRASRRNITIVNLNEDKILVEGVDPGNEIITIGLDNVLEGYKVKSQER
jgi:multidrug efflux pump subunit AcrA (membrane-fusion protein)